MRIGELSRRTGVSRRSIRYYEQHGLLLPERTSNGWRHYDATCEHRVRAIADLLGKGLTIDSVRQLGPCLDLYDPAACDDPGPAIEIYRSRLAVLDDRLARLQAHRNRLAEQLGALQSAGDRSAG
ncbi:MerR family transcriptional regulator [Nocardia donostiensis]|uniref:HTH merR-type domain-containing protein n=1 Tax=Nocardia donostiensis TaxID=1538463 RepID=A0A1W0B9G9_9NOCA|nr:MerR family transcriptional regulator [Nocardia donostiensis]ONM46943.1 hypothetical protein B0T46_20515 [Nocardia donostiensis]OQS13313.1 hypothetical protein B0T36_20565 [Nocardia donostiensis]OQS19180.1 hypothetical protein B0T44_15815 [Nocardia donostiensis]